MVNELKNEIKKEEKIFKILLFAVLTPLIAGIVIFSFYLL